MLDVPVAAHCSPESGTCTKCIGACSFKPGWFMPGEAEKVAHFLDLTVQETFDKYLAVDWWEAGDEFSEDVFVLSPAVVGEETGTEFPGNPRGTCVFFAEGRCQIHPVKPHECRQHWCGEPEENIPVRHEAVAHAWHTEDNQAQIAGLLGREPQAAPYFGGLLGMLGGY